jgi:hypothetical protein
VSARGLLGCLALAALHAVILLTPALAAGAVEPERSAYPFTLEQAAETAEAERLADWVCYTRPLEQGSGSVRVCEVRP